MLRVLHLVHGALLRLVRWTRRGLLLSEALAQFKQ